MSKKDKSKFKKLIKAQLAQEMAQAKKVSDPIAPNVSDAPSAPHASIAPIAPIASAAIGEINLSQIKYDLKKTGVVVGFLVIIMGIIYYLDLKYGILLTFGNWLFRSLHIQ